MWPAWSDQNESGSFEAIIRKLESANCGISGELKRTCVHLKDSLREKKAELQIDVIHLNVKLAVNYLNPLTFPEECGSL